MKQSSGCRKHLLYWRSATRVLLALLGPICTCTRGPPALWGSHPHAATCSKGFFYHRSAWFTILELTPAAVLPVHYEHSWGFVCGKEKSYLSKLWRKSPLPCVTVSGEILGQVLAMCEHCHVRHYKWLRVACQTHSQSDLLYLATFLFMDCFLQYKMEVHW